MPVRWIDRYSYSADAMAQHRELHPVIIHQGALGYDVPARDLAVAPMHSINIGGMFYPAMSVMNELSISRAIRGCAIGHFHIEVDRHETIVAEGAPVESYRDDGCRLLVDNASTYFSWEGDARSSVPGTHWWVDGGNLLNFVRSRLAERAGVQLRKGPAGSLGGFVERNENDVLEGWAVDAANSMAPVFLEILIHGEPIRRTVANTYRVDLDHHRVGDGIGGFRFALPNGGEIDLQTIEVRPISDGAKLKNLEMAKAE